MKVDRVEIMLMKLSVVLEDVVAIHLKVLLLEMVAVLVTVVRLVEQVQMVPLFVELTQTFKLML